jgi:hypothetical protein
MLPDYNVIGALQHHWRMRNKPFGDGVVKHKRRMVRR